MGIIKRQGLKSSIVNYFGAGLGAFFFLIVFPNIINESYLGLVQMLLSITLVFSQLAVMGTPNVLFKYYEKWKDKGATDNYNSFSLIVILVGFVLFSIIFLLFKEQIISLYAKRSALFVKYYWVVLPLIFIQALTYYLEVYSMMQLRVTVPAFLREIVNRSLLIFILFLLAYNMIAEPLFIWLYLFIYILSLGVLLFYAIRFFNFRFGNAKEFLKDNTDLKEQKHYGRNALALNVLGGAQNFIDSLILPVLMGLGALGIYSRPLILGQMIHIPYRSIANIASPIFMEAWTNNDVKKIEDLNKKLSINLLLIGLFLFALIVVNADNFFSLLPTQYAEAKNVLYIIAFGRLLDMSFGLNSEILFSSKYYRWVVYFTAIILVITIGFNILLIPIYGMDGAALAVTLALVLFNITKQVFIYRKFHFHCFSRAYISLILISIVAIGSTLFVPAFTSEYLNQLFSTPIASVLLNTCIQSFIVLVLLAVPILYFKISPDLNDFMKLVVSGKIFKGGHKMEEL